MQQQQAAAMQAPQQQAPEDWLQRLQLQRLKVAAAAAAAAAGGRGGESQLAPNPSTASLGQQLQQQPSDGLQAQPSDPPTQRDAEALQSAQRRVLLQLRQQIAAAMAAKQLSQQGSEPLPTTGTAPVSGEGVPGQPTRQWSLQPTASLLAQLAQQRQQTTTVPAQPGPVLEVRSDLLETEGDRVVSALNGGRTERAWALNALCLLSFRQDLRLAATPGLLAALLPVLQEGLAAAVGLGGSAPVVLPDPDDLREQEGLPMLPGWQARRTARLCGDLFPDRQRLEERLLEAAAAATVLRNAAEVEQNSALLLDPPVMRCWTWCLNAARELVLQQAGPAPATGDGAEEAAGNGSPAPADGTGSGSPTGAAASPAREATLASSCGGDSFASVVVGGGPAADICTSLLQLATVLSGHMLLPAFFECGMMLMRSLLILLRPTWQQCCAGGGGTVLPPPLVALATQAVAAVATAYQPNIDILLSMTGAPGSGRPGSTLMQVVADMLVCPFDVFRQHAQQHVDEESPGWRHLLPTDAQLLREARRTLKAAASGHGAGGGNRGPTELGYTAAELCMLDMLAVLSQLRYLSSMLHLLWRVLTAAEPGGANARAAAAGCPRLLSTLCDIAVHQWPQHPVRWHAEGHTLRNPDAYPAYLRFLSHDMMPAMRERQELLQPLRADAAALLALLAADPETRASVAWCEGPLVTAVMSGTVPPTEPGVSALLARFAAQGGGGGGGGTAAPAKAAMPAPAAEPMQTG